MEFIKKYTDGKSDFVNTISDCFTSASDMRRVLGVGYSLWWPIRWGSARKGYLFHALGIWKGRDSLVEVYKRVEKSVIRICKRAQKGLTDEFYGFKKSGNVLFFVIDFYLKDSAFTAIKRDAMF